MERSALKQLRKDTDESRLWSAGEPFSKPNSFGFGDDVQHVLLTLVGYPGRTRTVTLAEFREKYVDAGIVNAQRPFYREQLTMIA